MKRIKLVWLLVAALLSVLGTQVWADDAKQDVAAQDEPARISAADLQALINRVSAIEKGSASRVSGWLQLWYTHDSYGVNTPGNTDDYANSKNQWDAFSVKRAEIVLSGTVGADPKVTFKLSLDPAQPSFNGLGGTAGTALTYEGTGSSTTNINPFTIVKDIYSQATYSPYFAFLVGQNKLWNDLEGRIPSNTLDFNNYTNIGGSAFGNKRDLGVAFAGNSIPLGPLTGEYYVTVIQGSGQSTADNNVDKDLAGRVGLTFDNLFVGSSAYSGQEPNGVRQYVGFESRWISGGFKAQAEFLTGSVNTNDSNSSNNSVWTASLPSSTLLPKAYTTPSGQVSPTGYYLQASYRLGDWRLGGRWDGYNANQGGSAATNQEWDTYTIGFDWFQAKDAYKLSLNWEDHLLSGTDEYNVWTLQSQISI